LATFCFATCFAFGGATAFFVAFAALFCSFAALRKKSESIK